MIFISAIYAVNTVIGKKRNVKKPSHISIIPGENTDKIKYIQIYANKDLNKLSLKFFWN